MIRPRIGDRPWVVPAVATALVVGSFFVFLLSGRNFDATRPDFFYLAEAFLHGRLTIPMLGPNDVVVAPGGGVYVPFGPFPAFVLLPLVAVIGPEQADRWQPIVNAAIAAADVGFAFWLAGRAGVTTIGTRLWLATLLGFSTAIWWVTTRGGVWHTGHLIATFLTLCALIETFGRRRPWLLGLLGGAAFLTRAPLIFALPLYALVVRPPEGEAPWWHPRSWPIRAWLALGLGVLPSVAFFLWYDSARFGSPFESGYGLATLPEWLADIRAQGLFSTVHLGMNLDYLFLHMPTPIPTFPFFQPDGLGMSILFTSPGLGPALLAPWRSGLARALGVTAVIVLIPSLLYYGGGWLQYGYRYALDSIPFVLALCALAAARRGLGWGWRLAIAFGFVVNLAGVYWAYHL
jgi:hypothetical protein